MNCNCLQRQSFAKYVKYCERFYYIPTVKSCTIDSGVILRIYLGGEEMMREKELSICIGIHHIATLIGILEGIYYLFSGKRRLWKNGVIVFLTAFQSWAAFKILADIKKGKSRLRESYQNLKRLQMNKRQRQRVLWGSAAASALFKVLPVRLFV